MDDLLSRLKAAKTDNAVLNRLINDYMPFLKKEISKAPAFQMEFEDRLSIAMLVFRQLRPAVRRKCGGVYPFCVGLYSEQAYRRSAKVIPKK